MMTKLLSLSYHRHFLKIRHFSAKFKFVGKFVLTFKTRGENAQNFQKSINFKVAKPFTLATLQLLYEEKIKSKPW